MYATCLFCNGDLGRNEVIEAFPVGRRLAFDGAKGRLWVVCRRCERWNLTPLEERWEAIEACEREFRATKLRVSTDEIGLARLKEGLELVRIGAPQRPEMAAWRYGDQFGRRRRRALVVGGATVAAIGGFVLAGPMLGLVGASAWPLMNVANIGRQIYRRRAVAARIPLAADLSLIVPRDDLQHVALQWGAFDDGWRWSLSFRHRAVTRFGAESKRQDGLTTALQGSEAIDAARLLLPSLNSRGAGGRSVREAVRFLEQTPSPDALFARAARSFTPDGAGGDGATVPMHRIPTVVRLALEMAAHEESERRALEGELHILEAAWRDAEEIAGIADDMFLPASVDEKLARLKRQREEGRDGDPR